MTGKGKVRRLVIEPSDNGGYISRAEYERPPRKKNEMYTEAPESKCVHADVKSLVAEIKQAFGGGGRKPPGKAANGNPAEWKTVATQMVDKD